MMSPLWLDEAWKEFGLMEKPGRPSNERVLSLFRDAHHPEVTSDETAWCAAFVGAVLERSGIESTRSLMARSYLEWGDPAEAPRPGAIAVFSRGSDPAAGHVGFVLAAPPGEIVLLGGNQGDAVTVAKRNRADLIGLRWPSSVLKEDDPDDGFEEALVHVLEMEGGYDDDPYDPGGPTNHGITLDVFAAWRGEVVSAANRDALKSALKSIDRATLRNIYRKRYWSLARCADLPRPIAFMHFDAAVNHGVGSAARMLQESVGTEADGEIGPRTRAAASKADPAQALETYANIRRARYRSLPHFWRFGKGWLRRTSITLERAQGLIARKPSAAGDQTMSDATHTTGTKWWGQSITIWGAVTTALSAILPPLASAAGFEISQNDVSETGTGVVALAQAITALVGTIATIYGRVRASSALERRAITFKI